MTVFKVTTPTAGYTGEVAGIAFAKGVATVDNSAEQGRRALAYFRRKDYIVEELPVESVDPAPAPADDAPPPPPPTRGDTKANWLAWAVEHGDMPEADAQAATRDQLAEKYLGPKED